MVSKNGQNRLSLPELRGKALQILVRELGYADAVRFMLMYQKGSGDYTRERHAMLPDLPIAELVREADALVRKQSRPGGAGKRRKSA